MLTLHTSLHSSGNSHSSRNTNRSLLVGTLKQAQHPPNLTHLRHLQTRGKPNTPRTSASATAAAAAVKSYKARVVEVFDGQAASNDPDPMQDAAQSQSAVAVASGGCSIFVMLADAEKVQLRAESYNAILCCSTLAYMSDIQAALVKWKTWLKPSGRLMFTCFQAPYDPETRLFYELAGEFGFTGVIDPLLPIGSEQQIRDLLSSAGYSNIGVEHKPLETTIPAESVDWYLKYMWDVSCSCPAHTLPLLSWHNWPESEKDTNTTPSLMKTLSKALGGSQASSPVGKVVKAASASVGGGGGAKAEVDLVQLAAFRRAFMKQGAELVAKRLTKDKKAVENLCTVIYVSARC
ncbi:MAG: hypothetical protein WDW38_007174 [Sanguina aurantia]